MYSLTNEMLTLHHSSPLFLSLLAALAVAAPQAAEPLRYNRDIRPILSDNCFSCHGFDPKHREAKLRLDTAEGATADHDGVRAIVPGDVEKSELWVRLNHTDKDEVMPPPKSHKTVTAAQKEMLRSWIQQGAKYEPHWAFVPLAPVALPKTKQDGWARNDLDRFIDVLCLIRFDLK